MSFKSSIFPAPVVYEWQKFLQREGIFVSHEGQPMHQKLLDGVVYLEKALIEDKDVKTLKLFDKLDAVATQLLPYIQNERMRRIHSEVIDDANKLVADEATNRLGKDDTHNFLRKTYKRISDF